MPRTALSSTLAGLAIPLALFACATHAHAQAGRAPRPIEAVVSMRGAAPGDAALPLTEAQRQDVSINFLEKRTAPALRCVYRKPGGGKGYQLTFWERSRPDPGRISGIFPVDLDMALSACPPTWGEAVALGWGGGAWEVAARAAGADAAERQADADRELARSRETPETRARAWIAQAESLPATGAAADLALARGIDAEIASMESRLDELHSRPFNDRLVQPGGLFERINRLGQVAFVKARRLDASPAGRKAFDAWDERLGGPAVSAVARLQKIVHYRQNRRVRMAEVTGDAGEREMQSWGNVDFSPVWAGQSALLGVFARHLDGRPTIDPAFQRRIAQDLERMRPGGDPGRPYYYHVPADPKPAWMMTPEEEETQGGRVAGGLVNAVMGVGDLMRLIDKVDADIRESRIAFWKCYAARCSEAGKTFYAYSHAMWTKDNFYFARPAMSDLTINRGMSFLGDGAIDGGPVSHCAPQANGLSEALAGAVNRSRGDPVASARAVVAVMKGPAYASWQACRDRMEYVFRPRFL
ncbi:hypothetical protein [uncultured Massilia sp.]|uniref:hypothetical protein n=1 Tax=uncultured Massilia sp. TaxID=169973 RepID=UPI0025E2B201|nr:hypothetical protein [uncultured Massilia sp.]